MNYLVWVPGPELRSSGKASSALSHLVIPVILPEGAVWWLDSSHLLGKIVEDEVGMCLVL